MRRTVALPTGVTLEYLERGRPAGVPVIFLHGVTDSCRSFEPLLEHVPPTIRALAVTLRGHGGSSKPADGYRYADMAADVRAFMDALRLPAAIVVGHSMGSMVAQRLTTLHPDRVAGLVLMGAFRTMHGHAGLQGFWETALSTLTDPLDPGFVREFQVSTLARPVPPDFLAGVVHESLQVPARVWRETFRGFLETHDFSHELARVSVPTLIAWGELDAYATRADQDELRAALTGSRLIIYPQAGHAFHWEDPGRFAADLIEFVYEQA